MPGNANPEALPPESCVEAEPLDMGSQAEPWNQLKTRVFPAFLVIGKHAQSFLPRNKLQKALPPVTF